MKRILSTAVAVAAALTLSGPAMAAQAAHAKTTSAAKSQSATGKVTKYDASSRTLTISTSKGEESFVLAGNAKVQHGAKVVSDPGTTIGETAKVHFTEANGVKTAQSVSVSGAPMAKSSPKPHATTKTAPKK